MSIHKKINEVMKKVEFITKDGTLGWGNNTFSIVTRDKVVSVIRPFLVEAKVNVYTAQVEKGVSVPTKTSKGGDQIRFEAMYSVMFYDTESDTSVSFMQEGHGVDNADKAPGKASTYAEKTIMLKTLLLQTGDDITNEMSNKVTPKQATMLQGLVTQTGADEEKFLTFYNAAKYTDIAQDQFQHAIQSLQNKKAK